MNIVNCIRKENQARLANLAVVEPGRKWSYAELLDKVTELRCRFEGQGIGSEDRIAFRCEDGIEFIAGSLALLEAGAAIVPVDVSLSEPEVADTLNRIAVRGCLLQEGSFKEESGDKKIKIEGLSKGFVWRRHASGSTETDDRCGDITPAFIRFSSGTTGASKGVVLSHQSIHDRTEAANDGLQVTEKDRILWVLQMSHHFVVSILLFLRKGATIIIAHHDFPMSILHTASEGNVTFIYASPFHYHLLAMNQVIKPGAFCNVRLAISTAMQLPPDTAGAFAAKFGFDLAQAYGIIEVGLPFINLKPSAGSRDSVGQILPAYELRIENPDRDGVGHVLIRGKGMFDAYYSPWQEREDVLENGWFRTGDLGYLGEHGNLQIAGREKSVIICAGMKIFPAEVEQVLNAHPDVAESLVYSVEHPIYGQTPEAKIVVARPGLDEASLQHALRRHCYAELSSYKVPKSFTLVPCLPRTTSGKLSRR